MFYIYSFNKKLYFFLKEKGRIIINVFIGIPFYNNEETLEDAIISVINQSYKNWKLVLVNDGSTDQSNSIAKKYLSDQVVLINDGKNKGLISRLNQLIDMADSDIFVRMDADDIMHPDRLIKQVSFLEKNKSIDVIGSQAFIINEKNQVVSVRGGNKTKDSVYEIIKYGVFIHPSIAGKTKWFKKNKYHKDYDRAEDLELWCRTFSESNFHVLNEPLLFYRDPEDFNFEKYYKTHKTLLKIIDRYVDKKSEKLILIIREKIKINIYRVFNLLPISSVIYERRNPKIDNELKENADLKLLEAIS